MIERFTKAATSAVLLFTLLIGSHTAAQGQGVRLYRGGQGRRVGRVTLPTPPFNPNAGILSGRKGREHGSTSAAPRRSTRHGIKSPKVNNHGKTRKRLSKRR